MSKPDWKYAPEWAQWLAMDRNGTWWWFRYEPKRSSILWASEGYYERAIPATPWSETLEPRTSPAPAVDSTP